MSITLNLTLQLILEERCELKSSKEGMRIYDHSGNVHFINGIQSKDIFNMRRPFSLYLIQELNLENRQTLDLIIKNPAFS